MTQLNLNLHTHAGAYLFNACKSWHVHALLYAILECICGPVNTQNTIRDIHHKLALGLPHYTCGVATSTVAAGNEMQLFCSWLASLLCCNEDCLKLL